jgi:hypothetical protein
MVHAKSTRPRGAYIAALLIASAPLAWADGDDHAAPLLPQYQQECGACHVAYPPSLLPATSWSRLLGKLSQHFGTDASLDAASLKALSTWIQSQAGGSRRMREEPPQDRITRSAWFGREHREVAATTWKLPAVKSPANCAACHTQADTGDYRERNIRIPR